MTARFKFLGLLTSLLLATAAPTALHAAAFTPGNITVLRLGTGAAALSSASTAVFIDEYTPAGLLVQSVPLPTAASGANQPFANSGSATSEGLITRSVDGSAIVAVGYGAVPGVASISGTASATTPRVVARINAAGVVDTSTALTDVSSGNNPRGAASIDGNGFWLTGGAGGLRYATVGATTSTAVSSIVTNLRSVSVYDNQLYISTGSGSTYRVASVGTGTPTTTGQGLTQLPSLPVTGSPYAFYFADLSAAVAGVDTLYIADETAATGIQKYTFNGTAWALTGNVAGTFRGLTARTVGSTVTLYATRGGNELVSLIDSSGYNGTLSGAATLLATASANTAFRGVAFAPEGASAADLSVSVTAPSNGTINVPFNYDATVSNIGGAAASNITLSFTLPSGVTLDSTTPAGGFSCGAAVAGVVTCTGGSLNASATALLRFSVVSSASGNVSLSANAAIVDPSNTITESNELNNSGPATALVTNVSAAANTPPTIQAAASTTARLSLAPASPGAVSAVIADATDPARVSGIDFTVTDAETLASALTISAVSSNPTIVPNTAAALAFSGTGGTRTLRITPAAAGKADITVTVTDGASATATYILNYAASAAGPTTTRFHTNAADASTAIAIDANYMLVADDESQVIRLYDRANSGMPVNSFDLTASLGLTDLSGGVPREVDIEASTRVGNRVFWLGSHSNSSSGVIRVNRSRLFATDLTVSGATSSLAYVGRYDNLKADLIAWDQTNGHGLGANFFGLAASGGSGVIPEATDGSGFNVEGLTMLPGSTTQALIGLRAPIVPTSSRTRALVVPITNFAALVSGNPTTGPATFGTPVQLDLGGRGIRSMEANASQIVIVAGPADTATGVAPKDFRLYTWTGNAADTPLLRAANLANLNPEGIVEVPATLSDTSVLDIVSDNGDTVYYGDGVIAKDLTERRWAKFRVDRIALGAPVTVARIRDIQGQAHTTPLLGTTVSGVEGVVTLLRTNGFFMQDTTNDANDATSEGLFVFTSSAPTVTVGQLVSVSGTVAEFRSGTLADGSLSVSQISSPTISVVSSGNALPAPITIGTAGRTPPTAVIDAATGNVETGLFRPTTDAIDFYESLEGMRVRIENAVAVGPSDAGEVVVVPDNGAWVTGRTARGGILINANDFNPERIFLLASGLPTMKVGDRFDGAIEGVLDYTGGNYKVRVTNTLPTITPSTLTKQTTTLAATTNQLTVATLNVENLAPSNPASKFTNIASTIVGSLQTPDVVLLEEVQDNTGATNNGVVDASTTINTLVTAITTAGGPTYSARQIDPVNGQDGGQGGGNIRQVFLFNPARVGFVDRGTATSTSATTVSNVGNEPRLNQSPGRIDPTNAAFSTSRKPLVGEFTFNGHTVYVIGNHFNSKGGDGPLFGFNQPPILDTETKRSQQATAVAGFVQSLYAIDPTTNVIVLGDLNDFEFSPPLNTLKAAPLTALIEKLPQAQRYTYVFQGNSQALDHILVSPTLDTGAAVEFDIVHVNAEYPASDRISDHDPSVARFTLEPAPTRLAVTAINATSPFVNTDFNVTVASVDAGLAPRKVLASTTVTITRQSGTGTLSGAQQCTIATGQTSCVIAGMRYGTAETGVSLLATASSGKRLAPGQSVAFNVVTAQTTQTITFLPLAQRRFGDAPFAVSATASSGLPVTFTSQTVPICTVSGTTVTLVAVGTCTIEAAQAGDGIILPVSISQSFAVTKGTQTITFAALSNNQVGQAQALAASASSGLTVSVQTSTSSVCRVNADNTVTSLSVGTCALQATQPGNANYDAAAAVERQFSVGLRAQTISFSALSTIAVGVSQPLSVSASSGLIVTVSSLTPIACSVEGATVKALATGTCS